MKLSCLSSGNLRSKPLQFIYPRVDEKIHKTVFFSFLIYLKDIINIFPISYHVQIACIGNKLNTWL